MLVWGISNPEGVENENSLYLSATDIHDMVRQVDTANLIGSPIPVKIEHKGVNMGRVVCAWEYNGQLQCMLDINESIFEGSVGSEFVRHGIAKDLSLGYDVSLCHSASHRRAKRLREISIVKKGARHNCHILGTFNEQTASGKNG